MKSEKLLTKQPKLIWRTNIRLLSPKAGTNAYLKQKK